MSSGWTYLVAGFLVAYPALCSAAAEPPSLSENTPAHSLSENTPTPPFPENTPDTLSREDDPILLTGSILSPLFGASLEHLGCFAKGPSGFTPIPCQVDERTEKGEYVFTGGSAANLEDGDQRLSEQDELLFMARDAGGRISAPSWPEGFKRGLELEIVDPLDSGRAYVYLAEFAGPAPRAPRDDVRYTPGDERVSAATYELTFSKKAPIVFDSLVIRPVAGGLGYDTVDRMKIRLKAKIWDTIPINKTEDDYTVETIGYVDGPIRVIRRTRIRLVLFWKIPSPSAVQDNFFYGTFFEFPVVITLPLDLDTFLSECDLRISMDSQGAPGRMFLNSRNPDPVLMDGVMSPKERALDTNPAAWSVTFGTEPGHTAGWVNRLSIRSNVALNPDLFYVDESSAPDGPEDFPGQIGNVGYQIRNLKGLTKGTHVLSSALYSFREYTPGLEQRFLAIKDSPLQVRSPRTFPCPSNTSHQ